MRDAWREYYTNSDIEKIHRIELELLNEFRSICDKLDISFFLYGGSMLGAIKYGGFVPWDDDLDVAMMRSDYNKLIKYGPSLLSPKYEFQHPVLTPKSPYPYLKLRKNGTKMVEYVYRNLRINHGVYFDIYPIDNISDSDDEIEAERVELLKYIKILQKKQTYSLNAPPETIMDYIHIVYNFMLFVFLKLVPTKLIMRLIDSVMTRHNDERTKRQGNLFFPKPVNYFNEIFPLIKVRFESMDINIPQGYQINLFNRYGDISVLPPASKRVGHKPYILDLGN